MMKRIADDPQLFEQIKTIADMEDRSESKMYQILLREAINARNIREDSWRGKIPTKPKKWPLEKQGAFRKSDKRGDGVIPLTVDDDNIIPMTAGEDVIPMAVPPVQKPVRRSNRVEPVNSCPHGYAIGMCKIAECNRKYAK